MLERLESEPGVVVGLDPHLGSVPGLKSASDVGRVLTRWSCETLDAVAAHVGVVKPQSALYERFGAAGFAALEATCAHARSLGLGVLLDAKRGDIGSTAEAYAAAAFADDGPFRADAVTLSPYLGPESLAPFLRYLVRGKMVFVLLRTSNPGAGTWQQTMAPGIAAWVRAHNDAQRAPRVGVVVGATVNENWRSQLPRAWFLTPGIGAQGATLNDVIGRRREDGGGVLPTASRSILFDDGPLEGRSERVAHRAMEFARAWSACYQSA